MLCPSPLRLDLIRFLGSQGNVFFETKDSSVVAFSLLIFRGRTSETGCSREFDMTDSARARVLSARLPRLKNENLTVSLEH